jgi:poly(A) polymerase
MEPDQLKKLRKWVVDQTEFGLLFEIAPEVGAEFFLVGGLVRDWFLARDTQDVDLALSKNALQAAGHFARRTGGTFVLLRKEGEIARVVLQDRTFDFAKFKGPDLETDLRGRDFTVDAIALSLTQAFIGDEWIPYDPLNGIGDINNRVLKMTRANSFEQDPLRMLRACRLSAQLGLTIDPDTSRAIEKTAPSLTQSAPERLHYEWLMLLSQPSSFFSVQAMDRIGLLEILFPEINQVKGIEQDRYHHLDVYRHSLLAFQCLEKIIQQIIPLPEELKAEVQEYWQGNQKAAWLKWAALMHDLGKAATGAEKAGQRTFYGHAKISQDLFGAIAERLRLGKHEKDFIDRMIGWHMRPMYLMQEETQKTLTRRAVIRLIQEIGKDVTGLFLLALADSLAAQGKEKPKDLEDRLSDLWRNTISVRDTIIRPLEMNPPLVSGKDLIELGMKPGPVFKAVLTEIREEQLEGKISDRPQALGWIKRRFGLE